jgi:hypothetical protein
MEIRSPETVEEFMQYYELRWRLLRKPWNQPKGSEKDEKEDEAFHKHISLLCIMSEFLRKELNIQ